MEDRIYNAEFFRTLVESVDDIVYVVDHRGHFVYLNPKGKELTGYSLEDLRNLHYLNIIADFYRDVARGFYRHQVLNGVDRTYYELPIQCKNGKIIWVGQNVHMVNRDNAKTFWFCIARDITEQKSVEKQLSESEERFRKTFEQAPIGMIILAPNGSIMQSNKAFQTLLEYSEEELRELTYTQITYPEDVDQSRLIYREIAEEKRSAVQMEKRYVTKKGNVIWGRASVSPVFDTQNELSYCIVMIEDISEHKKRETVIRKMTRAVENAADMVVLTDENGHIEYTNSAFEQVTGYTRAEVMGKPFMFLRSREEDPDIVNRMWETVRHGEVWQGLVMSRKKNGELFYEEQTVSPILDTQGKVTSLVAVKRDVTRRIQLERERTVSRILLERIIHELPSGIFIFDTAEFKLKTWNKEAEEILGVNPGERMKSFSSKAGFAKLFDLHDLEGNWYPEEEIPLYAAVKEGVPAGKDDIVVYHPDGEKVFISAQAIPLHVDAEGQTIDMVLLIFQNETEKRKARLALEESAKRQEAILASVAQGVNHVIGRIFQFVNPALCEMFGYKPEELIGRTTECLYRSKEEYEAIGKEVVEQIEKTGKFFKSILARRKDGSTFECEISGRAIDLNDFSKGFVGVWQDVTERNRYQRRLQQLNTLLNGVLDASDRFAIITTDLTGNITLFNRGATRMLQWKEDEILNIHTPGVFFAPGRFQLEQDEKTKMTGEDAFHYCLQELKEHGLHELRGWFVRKDGSTVPVHLVLNNLLDDKGSTVGYLLIARDIREELQAQEKIKTYVAELQKSEESLRKLNAQKDKFLSIVSHDLRSPFNSILGFCDLLLDESVSFDEKEQRQYLQIIANSARQQLELVNNLLDWSRLETGRLRYNPKKHNLAALVRRSFDNLSGNARRKGITLKYTGPEIINIRADDVLVIQLLTNLIGNALKFSESGGEVEVSARPLDNDMVETSVRDTGVGIAEEDLEKLFRIDAKFTSEGTEGEKGSGLGLALCKEITEIHGGSIRAESKKGEGSTFTFTLPGAVLRSVLLVEDVRSEQLLYRRLLSQLVPYASVHIAQNGAEAIEIMKQHTPDLVITDYDMPLMNGEELIRTLKSDEKTKRIPVVVVTGVDSMANSSRLVEAGADMVVRKPVTQATFHQILDSFE